MRCAHVLGRKQPRHHLRLKRGIFARAAATAFEPRQLRSSRGNCAPTAASSLQPQRVHYRRCIFTTGFECSRARKTARGGSLRAALRNRSAASECPCRVIVVVVCGNSRHVCPSLRSAGNMHNLPYDRFIIATELFAARESQPAYLSVGVF